MPNVLMLLGLCGRIVSLADCLDGHQLILFFVACYIQHLNYNYVIAGW